MSYTTASHRVQSQEQTSLEMVFDRFNFSYDQHKNLIISKDWLYCA